MYYYKYTVQGINIFALSILFFAFCVCFFITTQYYFVAIFLQSSRSADLLPLVVITLIIGYADHDHNYFTSVTKFTTAIISIIPLSYFIGMGIAR